jgi:hypothetical protein
MAKRRQPPSPGYSQGKASVRPSLSLRLRPGWRLAGPGEFADASGAPLHVAADLPRGAELVPTVPALAAADPKRLSAPERELARHVQLILPAGADPAKLLPAVKRWASVEDVRLPPDVSLP